MSRQKTKRAAVRKVVDAQHGVIARAQLVACGVEITAIDHQLRARTLRSVHRGVYALGHRQLRREGWLMAAILACGPGAVLSHHTAAAVWGLGPSRNVIEVTLPPGVVGGGALAYAPTAQRRCRPPTSPSAHRCR